MGGVFANPSVLSGFSGSVSYVPHGGIFAVLAGGVTNPLMYAVAWLVGGIVGALLLSVLVKKPADK